MLVIRNLMLAVCLLLGFSSGLLAQQTICINGRCYTVVQPQPPVVNTQPANTVTLVPLQEQVDLVGEQLEAADRDEDRFEQITRATVRVTVSGVCGSGTVVGRDSQGNALVLTNAHVAGTSRGRVVNVERWNTDGSGERGQAAIIAAGYGRGMSVDFALLKCNSSFASDVTPIPLADRYPDTTAPVTTFGCPRCEWPSLQVLKLNRSEGQILTWKPQAIGGRSGSSVVDLTDVGPRVVGLLTWGGGGEGLGQSTPFLLEAMRGRLPQSLESLPVGAREVAAECCSSQPLVPARIFQMPATTGGEALALPVQFTGTSDTVDQGVIDDITEDGLRDRRKPKPDDGENGILGRDPSPGLIGRGLEWVRRLLITAALCVGSGVAGFFLGRLWK